MSGSIDIASKTASPRRVPLPLGFSNSLITRAKTVPIAKLASARTSSVIPRSEVRQPADSRHRVSNPRVAASDSVAGVVPTSSTTGNAALFHPCPTDPACPFCDGGGLSDRSEAADWSFLDAVYCISLQSRDDRAASVEKELHRVGLCRHTTFYRPIKHPRLPKIGVWESHRAVARHALQRHGERVLVLEDDVVFSGTVTASTTASVERTMQRLPKDWMAFYLGHWVLWMSPRGGWLMRSGSLCTHAYVASPRLLHWLCDHPFSKQLERFRIGGKGIDAVYAALPAMYSLFPMIAVQNGSPSDHMKAKNRRTRISDFISNSRFRDQLLSGLMRPNEVLIFLLVPVILTLRAIVKLAHRRVGKYQGKL